MRYFTLSMLLLLLAATPVLAGDHGPVPKGLARDHGWVLCPHCAEPCYPSLVKAKETRHCWDVDTKVICVPRVRFPWEHWGKGEKTAPKHAGHVHGALCGKGCGPGCGNGASCPITHCPPPKCGYQKVVNVLMKVPYECPSCEYKWEAIGPKAPELKDEAPAPLPNAGGENTAARDPIQLTPAESTPVEATPAESSPALPTPAESPWRAARWLDALIGR